MIKWKSQHHINDSSHVSSTGKVICFRKLLLFHRVRPLLLSSKVEYFSNTDSLPSLNSMLGFFPSVCHDQRHNQSYTELIYKLKIKFSHNQSV